MPLPAPSEIIKCKDIASCFQTIYNFFFAILIALAFLNFIYGAFLYLLSAGKVYSKDAGKNKMVNSIIAVIVVLTTPIILNMINPGIFKIEMKIPIVEVKLPQYIYSFEPGKLPGTDLKISSDQIKGKADCNIPQGNNLCAPSNLRYYTLNRLDDLALRQFALICINESGGSSTIESKVDVCEDGNSFSIGLFQINMVATNFTIPGENQGKNINCNPGEIFEYSKGTSTPSREIDPQTGKYKYKCKVINQDLYKKCKNALKDPQINIDEALKKFSLICINESGGDPTIESKVDVCEDGNSFSIGLFQINMVATEFTIPAADENKINCNPDEIFNYNKRKGTPPYNNKIKKYECTVKNKDLYDKCKAALKITQFNIDEALKKANPSTQFDPFRGRIISVNFKPWSVWPIIQSQCEI